MARKIKLRWYGRTKTILLSETDEKFQVLASEIEKKGLKVGFSGRYEAGYGIPSESSTFNIVLTVYKKKSLVPIFGWKPIFKYRTILEARKELQRGVYYELVDKSEKPLLDGLNSALKKMGYDIRYSADMNKSTIWPK